MTAGSRGTTDVVDIDNLSISFATDSRAAPFTERPKPRFRSFSITRQGTQVESSATASRKRDFNSSSSGESLTAITRQSVAANSAPTRCSDSNRLVTSEGCL